MLLKVLQTLLRIFDWPQARERLIAAGANEIVGEVLAILGPKQSAHFLVLAFVLLHERRQLLLSVDVHAREKLLSFDVVRI